MQMSLNFTKLEESWSLQFAHLFRTGRETHFPWVTVSPYGTMASVIIFQQTTLSSGRPFGVKTVTELYTRSTRQSDVRCTAVQSAWSCMDKLARLYVADQLISKFEVGRRFLSICRLTTADYYGPDLFKGWQVGKVWFCWCYAMSI